jgi:hypothetical protein
MRKKLTGLIQKNKTSRHSQKQDNGVDYYQNKSGFIATIAAIKQH